MREGRDLELLLKKIEGLKLPDATIKSPDYIPDVDTGQLREIDVGIRIKADSEEIFIAIECRDRGKPQDVQWIEQLIAKKVSIGADLLIGVSSSSFTGPAITKAKKRGVELRDIKYFDPGELLLWADAAYVQIGYLEPYLLGVGFVLDPPIQPTLTIDKYDFYLEGEDRIVQWQEFLALVLNHDIFLEFGRKFPTLKSFTFTLKEQVLNRSLIIPPKVKIERIKFHLKAVRKIERIPLTIAYSYKDVINNKEVAEGYSYGQAGAVAQIVTDLPTDKSYINMDFAALRPHERVIEYVLLTCRKEIALKDLALQFGSKPV